MVSWSISNANHHFADAFRAHTWVPPAEILSVNSQGGELFHLSLQQRKCLQHHRVVSRHLLLDGVEPVAWLQLRGPLGPLHGLAICDEGEVCSMDLLSCNPFLSRCGSVLSDSVQTLPRCDAADLVILLPIKLPFASDSENILIVAENNSDICRSLLHHASQGGPCYLHFGDIRVTVHTSTHQTPSQLLQWRQVLSVTLQTHIVVRLDGADGPPP
mmetsp:Transcript_65233/g.155823  ORF Transcript_65233/g.155823 Transcript_65233/m.155823 type:complete len:215 (+) Transcript_65233:279-923(+)